MGTHLMERRPKAERNEDVETKAVAQPGPEQRTKRVREVIKDRAQRRSGSGDALTIVGLAAPEDHLFPAADLRTLGIDPSYQRLEIRAHVNHLIAVLESGGEVPVPIIVARRRDGSLWVVDGQQRYWAHWHTHRPIRALIYDVVDLEQERQLFIISNRTKAVAPGWKLRAWPGPSSELVAWMASDPESPFQGRIAFRDSIGGSQHRASLVAASIIVKGLAVAVTASAHTNKIEEVLEKLDRALNDNRARVFKIAQMFGVLIYSIMGDERAPHSIPTLALGIVAGERWRGLKVSDAFPLPQGRSLKKLQEFQWDRHAPSHSSQWLPVLVPALSKIWKS